MASSTGATSNAIVPKKYSREIVLLVTLLLLLAFAIFTAFAARLYHKKYHVLGDEWFARGEKDFHFGNAMAALRDYRNALLYSPANTEFQFHLAQALAANGRNEEARAYLLALLSDSPGSGEINLELARIAAEDGAKMTPDALRYYHAAIYGVWDNDPIARRWQVRRELCEYLLNNNEMNQAEAEIVALADNTSPEDIPAQKAAGNLLLRTRMWSRALQEFQTVLSQDPDDEDALAGAATAGLQKDEGHQNRCGLVEKSRDLGHFGSSSRRQTAFQRSEGILLQAPTAGKLVCWILSGRLVLRGYRRVPGDRPRQSEPQPGSREP